MKKVDYNKHFIKTTKALENNGAFLTVKTLNSLNTMTIGWANIGYIWSKPMFMVAVRKSRYTYELIESTDSFTVSIPFKNKMQKELKFCGSKSGRNYDKFKELNLKKINNNILDTPLIAGCDLHYECKIVYKQKMESDNLITSYQNRHYTNNDYHTLYFGEIINTLREE